MLSLFEIGKTSCLEVLALLMVCCTWFMKIVKLPRRSDVSYSQDDCCIAVLEGIYVEPVLMFLACYCWFSFLTCPLSRRLFLLVVVWCILLNQAAFYYASSAICVMDVTSAKWRDDLSSCPQSLVYPRFLVQIVLMHAVQRKIVLLMVNTWNYTDYVNGLSCMC